MIHDTKGSGGDHTGTRIERYLAQPKNRLREAPNRAGPTAPVELVHMHDAIAIIAGPGCHNRFDHNRPNTDKRLHCRYRRHLNNHVKYIDIQRRASG